MSCKLTLNNASADLFHALLKTGQADVPSASIHAHRLVDACEHFKRHLDGQLLQRGAAGSAYLEELFHAVTQKLAFTFYTIEEECEIGMTFELMNSRGKDLSVLELLKNYFMHWISRNVLQVERPALTEIVNRAWKTVYTNIGLAQGDEDQCLRVAWTLYCSHTPAKWSGYNGFKAAEYIPLRNFSSQEKVQGFLVKFTEGLAELSRYYAAVIAPTSSADLFPEEKIWLTKLGNAGNIANFLPLLVAAKKGLQAGDFSLASYLQLLRALECYSYRVFLYNSRRSNAGKSSFYAWGTELFQGDIGIDDIVRKVHALIRHYSPENEYVAANTPPDDWYSARHLLRYTLFEYELHLLATEGKGMAPYLQWEQLNDSTIEHVLPQNPEENSHWFELWPENEFRTCLHDIGNLVLTLNNSNYRNFDFPRKKGTPGKSPSYCDSDIRQERRLATYIDWTPKTFALRRKELVDWINTRWATVGSDIPPEEDLNEDADEE